MESRPRTSRRPCRSARRSCLPELKLSDDGLYYWDGQQWVTTLAHDGHSRWNGTAWVPVAAPPQMAYFQPPRRMRVATGWTKPLQYAVAAWYLLQAIYAIALPFVMGGPMTDYINQVMQQQVLSNPDVAPPPPDFLTTVATMMTVALWTGAVIGVAIAVVAIIGALKRWTWLFYVVLVLLGLQAVSFPFTLISAFSTTAVNPVALPVALTATSVTFGIPAIALFVWMLVAVVKRGPWGMKRAV
jgi:hypothetical protein